MNNADRDHAEQRIWTYSFAALAVAIGLGTTGLALRAPASDRVLPTVGRVEIDYGADGEVEEVLTIAVEGFQVGTDRAPLAALAAVAGETR